MTVTTEAVVPRQRFRRKGWVSGQATSTHGAQFTSMPWARSSVPVRNPRRYIALSASGDTRPWPASASTWSSGGIHSAPMGSSHPLNAAALLIDQYRRITSDSLSERLGQAEQLVGRHAVSLKHDEPEGFRLGEKFCSWRQARARTARRYTHHSALTAARPEHSLHRPPAAHEQKRRASAKSTKPAARNR